MRCGDCGGPTKVMRTIECRGTIWRVRRCLGCGLEITTSEIEDEPVGPVWTRHKEGIEPMVKKRPPALDRERSI